MNRWKIAAALGVLILIPLTAAKCDTLKKPKCTGTVILAPTPAPECSLFPSPAKRVISDGVHEVGKDMEPGTWISDGVPSDIPDCVWFVTPDPSKDPDSQNLPSYTQVRGHRVKVVLERGMGFVSTDCGVWTLQPEQKPSPTNGSEPLPAPHAS